MDRVGLFVVIVIGEAVYLSVTGLAAHPTGVGAAAALFGFIVCALLARAFFQWGVVAAEAGLVRAQRIGSFGAIRDVVLYLPFFLVAALTLISAVIGISVEDAGEPMPEGVWILLAAGIAAFYLVNAIVGLRLGRPVRRIVILLVPAIALPTLACFLGASFAAWVTLAFAAAAMALIEVLSHAVARTLGPAGGIRFR
jgi:low temperature requirement protein LtrA